MRVLVVAIVLAVFGCAQKTPVVMETKLEGVEGYALGQPITYENATFIPVISTSQEPPDKQDDTITLSEAKKNNWVEIVEVPGNEQVDTLKVRNTGPKPLLLISGELLLGGKQDRIVAKDTIVPPGETKEVAVYCVEHGRWEGASSRFDYGSTMVPDRVRKAAQYGKQEDVWAGVAAYNQGVRADRTVDIGGRLVTSIRAGVNDKETREKVKDGLQFVNARLSDPNVVGVVFILNGEIKTFEFFGSPSLFKKANKSVLESFLAEAAAAPKDKDVTLVPHRWQLFVKECLTAPRQGRGQGVNVLDADTIRGGEFSGTNDAAATPMHGSFEPKKK